MDCNQSQRYHLQHTHQVFLRAALRMNQYVALKESECVRFEEMPTNIRHPLADFLEIKRIHLSVATRRNLIFRLSLKTGPAVLLPSSSLIRSFPRKKNLKLKTKIKRKVKASDCSGHTC